MLSMGSMLMAGWLAAAPALAQAPDARQQEEVLAAQQRLLEAYRSCSAQSFKELTTEDHTLVISTGRLLTRSQEIERCRPASAPGTREDQRVRFVRDDVAIITGVLRVRMVNGDLSEARRFTEVWTKQGTWKRAALQATTIAQ